jgi:multiple sugar transport system substrate-binding protein
MRRAAQRACLALLLATTALLVSCDGRHGHRTVLHVWAMGREAEVLAQLLPEFERDHPEVQVEIQQLAWTAAHEKLLTAVAGDATPDICQLGNSWIPELVALHALVPLDARVQASPAITASDYFAGVWQTNSVDGAQYGVPWYVDTRLLFYRADILKQAGFNAPASNWADWLVQLRAIKRVVGAERYSILLPLNEFEPLQVLALQQDESMLRDGNRYGNFESASFQRALGFYHQLFAESLAPRETNTQISNVWSELGKGYFSFYISGPWNIGEFKRRLPPEQQGSWMTAPMPGPEGPGVSNAGGSSLVIFKRSRYQAGAWALIEFLSRPDTQRRFYELTGDLPPRRSSWESGEISTDPYTRAFRTQLEQLRTFPQVPEWEQIMQAMRVMAERVVQDRESVAAASQEFDVEVDAMLAKRRWLLDKHAGGKVNGR